MKREARKEKKPRTEGSGGKEGRKKEGRRLGRKVGRKGVVKKEEEGTGEA